MKKSLEKPLNVIVIVWIIFLAYLFGSHFYLSIFLSGPQMLGLLLAISVSIGYLWGNGKIMNVTKALFQALEKSDKEETK